MCVHVRAADLHTCFTSKPRLGTTATTTTTAAAAAAILTAALHDAYVA
jgi:hypothetical protein